MKAMNALLCFIGWLLLLVLCWPIALLALVAFPVVWLLLLPFRMLGIAVNSALAFLKALLMLPAKALGYRRPMTRPPNCRCV